LNFFKNDTELYRFNIPEYEFGFLKSVPEPWESESWHELNLHLDVEKQKVKSNQLEEVLQGRSDFVVKLGKCEDDIPTMIFDETNCSLYDNI
jgi:hypothetical protein